MYIRRRRELQREAALNGKTYSKRDEKRILDVLGRGLLKDYPNPERIGCPGADVLKRIASHEMPLSEAEKWLGHLGSCSPCYADIKQLQEERDSRQRRILLAVAAGILLAVAVSGWALLHKRSENLTAQTAVLDLRNRSVARGGETNPNEQPLELTRTTKNLKISLPLGSSEGPYDVRIVTPSGEELARSSGTATVSNHVDSLELSLTLDSLRPGQYVLQVRRPDSEWVSYPLLLR